MKTSQAKLLAFALDSDPFHQGKKLSKEPSLISHYE